MRLDYIECGDSKALLQGIPDNSIDLTVTSPPYDDLRTYNGYSWDFEAIAKELYRVTKDGGIVVWIVNDMTVDGSETGSSFRQALYFKEIGFRLHDTMIWDKGLFTAVGALRSRYGQVFEYMFVLSKGEPKTFNPIKDRKNKYRGTLKHGTIRNPNGTTRQMSKRETPFDEYGIRFNIWQINPVMRPSERTGHPAQFPEALVADHIRTWTNEGDVVLDCFMGSGTTRIARLDTKRHYIGFEISHEYCKIAEERIETMKSQVTLDDVMEDTQDED